MGAHIIYIRGIPDLPSVKTVNVREAASLNASRLFTMPVGATATAQLVATDTDGANFLGQTYRWFNLLFPDGRKGWVRDDLLDVQGDLTTLGYGVYPARTYAFTASQMLPPPTTKPPTAPASNPPTGCAGSIRNDTDANVRQGPSIFTARVGQLARTTPVTILTVEPGKDGQGYRWMKITSGKTTGYVREDLLYFSADCLGMGITPSEPPVTHETPDLSRAQRFSSPVKASYTIIQEYMANNHKGVDLGIPTGTPIYASSEGKVAFVNQCIKCGPDAKSSIELGHDFWDPQVVKDPAWGYGFGNFVTLRYDWAQIPNIIRDNLRNVGLTNAFIMIIYAHLSQISVLPNQIVKFGTQLGLSGNSGNSTTPHLHIEVYSSQSLFAAPLNRIVYNPNLVFIL